MFYPNVVTCGINKVRVDYTIASPAVSMRIYQSEVKRQLGIVVADGVQSGTEITGLLQNKPYYFTVKLLDAGGVEIDRSPQKERYTWIGMAQQSPPRGIWNFIDDDGTLYGIGGGTGTKLTKSTDQGATWLHVYDFLEKTGAPYVAKNRTMFQALTGKIMRSVDGGTTWAKCLDLSHPSAVIQYWGWCEDWEGNLFLGQYGNVLENGSYVNVAYVWRSFDNGLTWERIDFFAPKTNKHIHQVRVDKYTNRLYVSIGDGIKQLWYSDDKGTSWTKIGGDNTGFTGMTVVKGARFFSDDQAPGGNGIWKTTDDINLEEIFHPVKPYNNQIYNLVAHDESELWAAAHNEFQVASDKASLLYSADCGKNWEIYADIPGTTAGQSFVSMAFDRWGQSSLDYMICSGGDAGGVVKIPRSKTLLKGRRFHTFPAVTFT